MWILTDLGANVMTDTLLSWRPLERGFCLQSNCTVLPTVWHWPQQMHLKLFKRFQTTVQSHSEFSVFVLQALVKQDKLT